MALNNQLILLLLVEIMEQIHFLVMVEPEVLAVEQVKLQLKEVILVHQ